MVGNKYIYGLDRIMNKSGMQYYQHNSHGDVVGITNSINEWTATYQYDAFGEIVGGDSGSVANNFLYCGEYFDAESGSYYLRARYYQPSIGRFTTADPHWNTGNMIYGDNPVKINERKNPYNPHNPEVFAYVPDINAVVQSGNLYGYGLNSQLKFVDSSGEVGLITLFTAVVVAIGGLVGLSSCDSSIADNSIIYKDDFSGGEIYFSQAAQAHMNNPGRYVPVALIYGVVHNNVPYSDPQGGTAHMYYSTITRNGKTYNLEVLYDEDTKTVYHFQYTQKAIGPLAKIER